MWNEQKIEELTRSMLLKQFGKPRGEEIFGYYVSARKNIIENVAPEIKRSLPQHTDHGPDHIANVVNNAGRLLRVDSKKVGFTGLELYGLILSILFHDSGNIYGRKDHQKRIAKIYDFACTEQNRDPQEKKLVLSVTEAHTGEARDGSKDTLKELTQALPMYGESVRLPEIAAVLRFSDELAEGPQRTSLFMHANHGYTKASVCHHQYAKITSVTIDPENERIALTYTIKVHAKNSREFSTAGAKEVEDLLRYTYKRIDKLNQERKYARHYCNQLVPFKRITIAFNFEVNGELRDLDLPREQLVLTDLVVPGDNEKGFIEWYTEYEASRVTKKIKKCLSEKVQHARLPKPV